MEPNGHPTARYPARPFATQMVCHQTILVYKQTCVDISQRAKYLQTKLYTAPNLNTILSLPEKHAKYVILTFSAGFWRSAPARRSVVRWFRTIAQNPKHFNHRCDSCRFRLLRNSTRECCLGICKCHRKTRRQDTTSSPSVGASLEALPRQEGWAGGWVYTRIPR